MVAVGGGCVEEVDVKEDGLDICCGDGGGVADAVLGDRGRGGESR